MIPLEITNLDNAITLDFANMINIQQSYLKSGIANNKYIYSNASQNGFTVTVNEYEKADGTLGFYADYKATHLGTEYLKRYQFENNTINIQDWNIIETFENVDSEVDSLILAKRNKMDELYIWLGTQLAANFTFEGNTFELSQSKAKDLISINAMFGVHKDNGIDVSLLSAKLSTIDNIQITFTNAKFIEFMSAYSFVMAPIVENFKLKRNLTRTGLAVDIINAITI